MKKVYTLMLSLFTLSAWAQDIPMQVIASAGGYFENSNAGISISWTLGEVAYTTLSTDSYILTQGFQQGNLFTTSIDEPKSNQEGINVFPNPVSDILKLRIDNRFATGNVFIEIFDVTGKLVLSEKMNLEQSSPAALNLSNLRSGIYILHVFSENDNAKKVIKLIKE
ncbi:T9SS type A sorting domain-containing protein [Tenuifilum thalassicum]|uniref:T9SS type A sorting domain-containing protein n=1 Tax=Tenuifilum thalassicum TaxID=2590900 RepID=A0A7D3XFA2_9BACT|nr:T9SS type A sorting domain-containing protein [Tenuifilum thalassicum]QKG80952.1 T9SS type A sorting domain-containing protein [Tenuifilum thalassicum]